MFDSDSSPPPADASTSKTLLERVRLRDPAGWERFVRLYGPVIFTWARRAGLQPHDAADVTQEVFQAVANNIVSFRYGGATDTFRGWLRTITANKVHDHFRAQRKQAAGQAALDQLAAPDPAALDAEPSPVDAIARQALDLIQTDFEPTTWRAFLACAVDGRTPAETAAELGLSVAAVYKAKSRVLNRLRRELEGLLD